MKEEIRELRLNPKAIAQLGVDKYGIAKAKELAIKRLNEASGEQQQYWKDVINWIEVLEKRGVTSMLVKHGFVTQIENLIQIL